MPLERVSSSGSSQRRFGNGRAGQYIRDSCKNHRITESQNRIGWKRPLRSSSPTVNLTLPRPPLHHVPKHLIQTSFKYLQGWQLNHCPGQPVPMLDNPFSEEKFPNIQSKPPLAQLEAISSCPITCYLGEETSPHLTTTSFQVVVESDKVSPQPPLLQAKPPQFPQPLLIRLLLQTLHQVRCPSLDTLQHLNVPLVVGGPKLNTVFEEHDHFSSPAGHAIFDTSQDAIGFLGHLGTLLAHIQAAVNQHPQVLLCQAACQPLFPKPVALHGVVVAQVQDLALGLVKPYTIDLGPSIQPVQVPLQSLPTLQQINTPTQLGVICKLAESALDPFIQIIDKDIKQDWPQHRALGNTACDRPPTGVNSIHHHSLGPAIQPVLNPAKSTPVQAMSSQFLQENALTRKCSCGYETVISAKKMTIHDPTPTTLETQVTGCRKILPLSAVSERCGFMLAMREILRPVQSREGEVADSILNPSVMRPFIQQENQLVDEADKWSGGEGVSSLNGMRTEPPAPQESLSASSAKHTQC
ncbi:hypothetical protein QYF61_020094 [Mycteria americana]|uniref:Uncharacterized protein n=1 Tax=Mycteria americana TaxID=33587 RepID=A0AAN7S8G1_MYCAM|nr:hypothetical protein QYF61_020094 [Mycteria americana]